MTEQEGQVPRPEEVIGDTEDLKPEQIPQPLPCSAGSSTDNPCPRPATTWMHHEAGDCPMCDEHARVEWLAHETNDWGLPELITGDWLRIARAWKSEELERLALQAHEKAEEESLKAEAGLATAMEVADAPRKGEERPNLTREQDETLRSLIRRGDALNDAYTTIEDIPEGQVEEERRRRILGVLVEERERANAEHKRYKEEIGLKN
jgi:hypothetical protein